MSPPEKSLQDFLQRWSRRKLAAAEDADALAKPAPEKKAEAEGGEQKQPEETAPEDRVAAFDPASLPPLESIEAATDIRPFLAPGVPLELTRAALRRAWNSDPAIRDFIGLAENQWDFTNPDSIPGFGSLELTPELRKMVAGLFDQATRDDERTIECAAGSAEAAEIDSAKALPPDSPAAATSPVVAPTQAVSRVHSEASDVAAQDECGDDQPVLGPRRHGAALPK